MKCLSVSTIAALWLSSPVWGQTGACERLASLGLKDTTVTVAQVVPAGAFSPPRGASTNAQNVAQYESLPEFCRVAATIRPSDDSEIGIEVWLPAAGWNGRFQAVGNGGWSGAIGYPALGRALARGYAAAGTDTGHKGDRASFAMGHPEKLTDFAWRAVHEMAVQGKAITTGYFGDGPKYSYWNGCSSGGKQGLKEVQRFPDDFDGAIVGAPANNWVHQKASVIAVSQAVHKDAASYIPPEKYPAIHRAALDACDGLDGVKDGIIENPAACRFDPGVLECKGEDSATCLTRPQVVAARKILSPTRNPRTGQEIFPGLAPGTELAWAVQAGPEPRTVAVDLWMYVVFQDPKWDYMTLDLDRDVARGDQVDSGRMAATDPNLKPFVAHGGKLLMYHGWSDPNIVPFNSINYYRSALEVTKAPDAMRLFMVPGMGHCGGGEGPNNFDMVSAIEQWVEQGRAPQRIIASRIEGGKVARTRPLCPYPQTAQYSGSGSTDEAANFVCKAPQ